MAIAPKLAAARAKQTRKEKPIQQYFGGSEQASDIYADAWGERIDQGEQGINQGLDQLGAERATAQREADVLWGNLEAERQQYDQRLTGLQDEASALQAQQLGLAATYGGAADASLGNFAAGRGAVQGAAAQLGANNFFGDYQGTRAGVTGAQGTLMNNNYLDGFQSGTGAILGNADALQSGNFTADYDASKGQVQAGAAQLRNTDYMQQYNQSRGAIATSANALENNNWDANFQAGRGAILGGADKLEQFADQSEANYQSAADAAFQAAQAQNQRNTLGMAAGRGANSVRTAIATANMGTQSAALDQQVVKAQEHNAIQAQKAAAIQAASGIRTNLSSLDQQQEGLKTQQNVAAGQLRSNISGMDINAGQVNLARDSTALQAQQNIASMDQQKAALQQQQLAQAAQIRLGLSGQQLQSAQLQSANTIAAGQLGLGLGQNDLQAAAQRAQNLQASGQLGLGLGAQDLSAAQLGAQRQQFATGTGADLLGLRGDLYGNNAQYQLASLGQMQALSGQNAQLGYAYGDAVLGANTAQRDAYLGMLGNQYSAELGAAMESEAQRQQWAKDNSRQSKFMKGLGVATFGILGKS